MTGPTFREATTADIEAVVALVESAYRGASSRAGWTTEADLLDGQRTDAEAVGKLLAEPPARVLLAESDGDLLACCELRREDGTLPAAALALLPTAPDLVGYFGMFAVRPGRQGGGLGRAVLAEAERIAAGWGAGAMRMTVLDAREDLIAWYQRRGYLRTGHRQPFPADDPRFGLPKVADLAFELLVKPL